MHETVSPLPEHGSMAASPSGSVAQAPEILPAPTTGSSTLNSSTLESARSATSAQLYPAAGSLSPPLDSPGLGVNSTPVLLGDATSSCTA